MPEIKVEVQELNDSILGSELSQSSITKSIGRTDLSVKSRPSIFAGSAFHMKLIAKKMRSVIS